MGCKRPQPTPERTLPTFHGHLPIELAAMANPLRALGMALETATQAGESTLLRDARAFAVEQLRRRGDVTASSSARFHALWARFVKYAEAHGVMQLGQVTAELVAGFVLRARTSNGAIPSAATSQLRRDAVRLLYKELRQFGLWSVDPTVDLVLPPRAGLAVRPLTDDEVERCRWAALSTLTATRLPALWAIGEAGASTREIACVHAADLDLVSGTVWLSGGPRTEPRRVPLTNWGTSQLLRRTRHVRSREMPVALDRVLEPDAGRLSAGASVSDIMARAGVAGDRAVKPRSLTAWVGRTLWLETGRIDQVARRLGLRSLDLAAELIGVDWRAEQDDE